MKVWKVSLRSENGEKQIFNLLDLQDLVGQYIVFESKWYDKFLERLESSYTLLPLTLEEVVSPDGIPVLTPQKYASYMFLLYRYVFKRYLPVSYLLKIDEERNVHLMAIYPEVFAEAVKGDLNIAKIPLESLVTSPEKVKLKQLIIAIPPTPKSGEEND
ncbi:MAG: hypothetical protein ACTSYM_08425 [Candidatus Baldrarchaeia archaeon]